MLTNHLKHAESEKQLHRESENHNVVSKSHQRVKNKHKAKPEICVFWLFKLTLKDANTKI